QTGGSRARAPGQDHSRRGRIRSLDETGGCSGGSRKAAGSHPASLFADVDGDRRREEHDDRVSAAGGYHFAVDEYIRGEEVANGTGKFESRRRRQDTGEPASRRVFSRR